MTVLGANRYGKAGIRLVTVARHPDRHDFTDLTVDVRLSGDFEAAHVDGDNHAVLPTDSMRGAVYGLAREHGVESPETFGLLLTEHFLSSTPAAGRAEVGFVAQPWQRIAVDGSPHPHAFSRAAGGRRTAVVARERGGAVDVAAGVEDLFVAKTAGSGFSEFLVDRFTTLAETDDRILATSIRAEWRYATPEVDFDAHAAAVPRRILEVFADHDSKSLQHTLHAMGRAVLEDFADVREIHFALPNQHHIAVDLSPYGLDNPGEVFVVTDRPFGVIEGTVTRAQQG